MKNLKKVLSLVLALAMALSLMTAAFATDASDFNDYDDVTYTEAVDVMTAIGVFNGASGNNFAPNATLTREQAAKIITYMLLGQEKADKLTATVAPYADVAADRWSAGAIAYCTNEGILAGIGGGKFAPTAQLTGLEFAKMLLVALGYDAKIEKLEGSAWAINTATLAINSGLDDDMEISLSKALTREEAAQMAFNTMKANVVKYDNKGTNITLSDGTSVVIGASAVAAYTDNKYADTLEKDLTQFAEKYCADLEKVVTDKDDLGRPGHGWEFKDASVGTYTDAAAFTYTAAIDKDDLKKDLKNYKVKAAVTAVKNADSQTTTTLITANTNATALEDDELDAIVALGGNGITVEIYANSDKEITKIVQIAPKFAEVTAVNKTTANKSHGAYTTYTVDSKSGKVYTTIVDEDKDVDTLVLGGDIAKNDMVTYYKGEKKLYINPVTSISGVLSSVTNKGVMTIDGSSYEASAITGYEKPGISKKEQNFYVDSFGYIIKAYEDASDNYAYVVPGTTKKVYVQNTDGTLDPAQRATLIFPDGTIETVTTSATWNDYAGKVVKYTINNKDKYVYAAPSSSRVEAFTSLADDATAIGSLKTNNDTVYYVANFDKDEDDGTYSFNGTVTTYTGYKNAPSYATLSNNTAMALDTSSTADGIADVVFIGDEKASATETGKYVYVKGTYTQTSAGYVFDIIKAGEDDTVTKDAGNALLADTLYSAVGAMNTKAVANGTEVQNKGGLLYINDKYADLTVAADVTVYTINIADDSVSVGTAADLSSKFDADTYNVGGTRGVYVEKDGKKATTIYILYNSEDGEGTTPVAAGSYHVDSWGSKTSGNVNVVIYDETAEKWLTQSELEALGLAATDFVIGGKTADSVVKYDTCTAETCGNKALNAAGSGFIKVHFDTTTVSGASSIRVVGYGDGNLVK